MLVLADWRSKGRDGGRAKEKGSGSGNPPTLHIRPAGAWDCVEFVELGRCPQGVSRAAAGRANGVLN